MLLPSRLSNTTLGDVLGALHRAEVTGILELSHRGTLHAVHLRDGCVTDVTSPTARRLGDVLRETSALDAAQSLQMERLLFSHPTRLMGEVLVESSLISEDEISRAVRVQIRERLETLFAIGDAELRFRVATTKRQGVGAPLLVSEFLHGRKRGRQARREPSQHWRHAGVSDEFTVSQALELLGLEPGAERSSIRTAFRRRAGAVHPDRYNGSDEAQRQALQEQFIRLSAAYRTLVA